jgi:hypothetical protein
MDHSIVCAADFDAIPRLFRDEEGALQLNKTSEKITKGNLHGNCIWQASPEPISRMAALKLQPPATIMTRRLANRLKSKVFIVAFRAFGPSNVWSIEVRIIE